MKPKIYKKMGVELPYEAFVDKRWEVLQRWQDKIQCNSKGWLKPVVFGKAYHPLNEWIIQSLRVFYEKKLEHVAFLELCYEIGRCGKDDLADARKGVMPTLAMIDKVKAWHETRPVVFRLPFERQEIDDNGDVVDGEEASAAGEQGGADRSYGGDESQALT
jgi:hypothetical protein